MRCTDGPSEYLFVSGTNGTYIYSVIITRPVKLAVSSFFPGSIWNLSFINNYIFKGGRRKYIYDLTEENC